MKSSLPHKLPGNVMFFQSRNESKENNTQESIKSNFEVCWFEEQVDTQITQKIVSNFEFYNFRPAEPDGPHEWCDTNTRTQQQHDKATDNIMIAHTDKKNDIFSEFLEKLLAFYLNKLEGSASCIDLCPCELLKDGGMQLFKNKEGYCSTHAEAYIERSREFSQGCPFMPLNALEIFIKKAMDNSLAKFKEEINEAINYKLECLKMIPRSVASADSETAAPKEENMDSNSMANSRPKQRNNDLSAGQSKSEESVIQYFGIAKPEVENAVIEHDLPDYQCESINIIERRTTESKQKRERSDPYKSVSLKKSINPSTTQVIDTPVIDAENENEMNPEDLGENKSCLTSVTTSNGIRGDDTSRNFTLGAINRCPDPNLLTDMTKFIYIIFESFRRLKEENMKSECETYCESEVSDLKHVEDCLSHKDETPDPASSMGAGINPASTQRTSCVSLEPLLSHADGDTVLTDSDDRLGSKGQSRVEIESGGIEMKIGNPIIESDAEVNVEANPEEFTRNPVDTGYSVKKFVKKNNSRYESSPSNKILQNLKELYMQNLNNMEQKMLSSYDCDDKYKCRIKKKFTMEAHRNRTILDSQFYCNLRSKAIDKRKTSEITKRINSRIRRKRSSNIISVRHNLIKSKPRSAFKSVERGKRHLSLDSTVMRLLDIDLKNRSSLLRKRSLSSLDRLQADEKEEERCNLLKRLYLISFSWGKRDNATPMMDQHLSNIYNAICLDYVTDDVYNSVIYISQHLSSGNKKRKDEIMRQWVKICNKPNSPKKKRNFNLDSLHQMWTQFRTKICPLARPSSSTSPKLFPALTYLTKENRLMKEKVIKKYARDILEYISDPKIYNQGIPIRIRESLQSRLE